MVNSKQFDDFKMLVKFLLNAFLKPPIDSNLFKRQNSYSTL